VQSNPNTKQIIILILCVILLSASSINKNNSEFLSLLKNNKITVVAPASGIDSNLLANLRNITALQLNIDNNCFNGKASFHSADNETRFLCLKNAIFAQDNNVIWTLRGGYGSAKLIPQLQLLAKPEKEKLFIGFSDMTALHLFFTQEWGWKTIHGNGIAEILKPDKERQNFSKIAKIISGASKQARISGLIPYNTVAKSSKQISGKLTGGNLTIVQTSIGTSWQIQTVGKILFLEDTDFQPYRLDRVLYHLQQAGLLDNVTAIIFGTFGSDNSNILSVLGNFAATLNIPVFKSNRFGHGKINDPIIYNCQSKILLSGENQFELIMSLYNS
jgi:muramoyltetrapeptide carboxypeptidase